MKKNNIFNQIYDKINNSDDKQSMDKSTVKKVEKKEEIEDVIAVTLR